jgi:hypothetical protein
MKILGAIFRSLITLALIAAVAYNTYTIQQLQEEVDQLKQTRASVSANKSSSLNHPHTTDTPSLPTPAEPVTTNPRHRNWEDARQEATEAFTALQKANNDAQTASRRTIADLQRRINDLSTRIESLKRQTGTATSPAETEQ